VPPIAAIGKAAATWTLALGLMTSSEYLRELSAAEKSTADHKWARAVELWRGVVEVNPTNGDHWDDLAESLYESGDPAGALHAYEKVRGLGVSLRREMRDTYWPGEILYRIACCNARLGNEKEAIDALREAVAAGLRNLERPQQDETWAALRGDDRVRRLLGILDVEGMSREDGWRCDVELFSRELKRRAPAPWQAMSEAAFDESVAVLSAEVGALSDAQVMARLLALLRQLEDGHAGLAPPLDSELNIGLPLGLYTFEEGTFVIAAAPASAGLLGSQLLSVDGCPLDTIWGSLDQVLCQDNTQQAKRMAPELLRWTPLLHALGLADHPADVTLGLLSADGREEAVSVAAVAVSAPGYPDLSRPHGPLPPRPPGWICLPEVPDGGTLPYYLRNTEAAYWFEHLVEHRVLYLQFNEVRDHPSETFAEFCDRAFEYIDHRDVERLVLDLRWNRGGNTLLSQALLRRLAGSQKIDQWGSLFVIIGRATFSAAQNTATAIERHTKAIFVGEPTGSRPNLIGETAPFELPYSRTKVNVSDMYWQTSWPSDHRPWIPPEIYAPPSFAAYREGRDPALEAILSLTEHLPGC
jgi:tetratricopeptide (TPR) repeat protein